MTAPPSTAPRRRRWRTPTRRTPRTSPRRSGAGRSTTSWPRTACGSSGWARGGCGSSRWSRASALARAARRDARRLVRLLRVDRRPWRVHEPVRAVALVHREQRLERLRGVADGGPGIAVALQPARDSRQRELAGFDVVELLPGDRGGDLRARAGAYRPGAEHRLVRRVLVEVEEDPLAALLLP